MLVLMILLLAIVGFEIGAIVYLYHGNRNNIRYELPFVFIRKHEFNEEQFKWWFYTTFSIIVLLTPFVFLGNIKTYIYYVIVAWTLTVQVYISSWFSVYRLSTFKYFVDTDNATVIQLVFDNTVRYPVSTIDRKPIVPRVYTTYVKQLELVNIVTKKKDDQTLTVWSKESFRDEISLDKIDIPIAETITKEEPLWYRMLF